MPKILIADDDKDIAKLIADSLQDEGWETMSVYDGNAVVDAINNIPGFDLIILDIMMPGMDGLEVCRNIRDKTAVPILFVTAKDRTLDMVLGLEMGADDYITKPFVAEELVAKVKAHLRRENRQTASSDVIHLGKLSVYRDRFEVTKEGEPIPLTTREFQLLSFLSVNRNRVLTREQIYDAVWGENYGDISTVTVTIKNLRDKVDPDGQLIKTVWGVGYKLVPPEGDI